MRVPIACTLSVEEGPTRLEEWRTMLARVAAGADRPAPTDLAFRIRDDARAELGALVDLVRREVTCCAFFEFSLQVTAAAVTLRVTVPPDASAILDEFVLLAQPAG
jgi:hypothetical protein